MDRKTDLYLHDVTSSYLEGQHNELGSFGYNRDKKRGKQQIVIGLLTDCDGYPVATRVFKGNTNDGRTVNEQIEVLRSQFKCESVTLVGDRSMLKTPQVEALPEGFSYITVINKPTIERLIKEGGVPILSF